MTIVRHNVPISELTSFKNQGQVKQVVTFETVSDIQSFLKDAPEYFILGRGSNTVIDPATSMPCFAQVSPAITPATCNKNRLQVSAGTPVNKLMTLLQEFGVSGLEFCAGVPASVGGMIAMNFGCFGHWMADFVEKVRVITETGEDRWISVSELELGYRTSIFHRKKWIIVEAIFNLVADDPVTIKKRSHDFVRTRSEKQPLRDKTFGSIFKNPAGHFAAQLIQSAGYKGYQIGDTQISDRHANFMINKGSATFEEILDILEKIQHDVTAKHQIDLELEVKLIS